MRSLLIILQINCFLIAITLNSLAQESSSYYASTDMEKVYSDLRIAVYEKEKVYRLDLSNQELKSFPEEIYELYNLQVLILDENLISHINFRAEMLPNLYYLSIKNNKLLEIDFPKKCLSGLKELYLDFNQLIEFPEINNDDIELLTLSLNNNFIAFLPLEDLSLTRLVDFSIDTNPLKNARVAFGYSSIIEKLSLHNTNLTSIPKNSIYKRILKLIISDNPIYLEPDFSSSFPSLEYLDLSQTNLYNEQSFLPICQLKSVKYLSLDECKLKSIPSEIENLKKLREISLIRNDLSSFPAQFYSMKLKLINLEGNPIPSSEKEKLNSTFNKATIHY